MGACRKPLGAKSVIASNTQIEATRVTNEVSHFILESSKPLWKGELADCGVLLGTKDLVLNLHTQMVL